MPAFMRADQARQVPIPLYLERHSIKPAKITRNGRELWYSSPIREGDKTPSFKVDTVKNLWFDHGVARGGNVIDLVVEMCRVSVKEALAILESGFAGTVPAATRSLLENRGAPADEKENEQDRSFSIVDSGPIVHPALWQYLFARCISKPLASQWLKEIRFRAPGKPKTYFALGFTCGEGVDARSPVFKGFVGKGKDISTINFADKGTVAVFEGPYDFLSWLAMRELTEPDCAVIILHSLSLKARAFHAINTHGFGRIVLYLDRDEAGRTVTRWLQRELGHRNAVDRSPLYEGFKDFNEWWVALGHQQSAAPSNDS
ncbi:MAG: toprim domain-containing protein [Hyphomicrobiaceae bacterium]|nr:toprim domain-containing protein [Hyphomicrobiaceae bacterium]